MGGCSLGSGFVSPWAARRVRQSRGGDTPRHVPSRADFCSRRKFGLATSAQSLLDDGRCELRFFHVGGFLLYAAARWSSPANTKDKHPFEPLRRMHVSTRNEAQPTLLCSRMLSCTPRTKQARSLFQHQGSKRRCPRGSGGRSDVRDHRQAQQGLERESRSDAIPRGKIKLALGRVLSIARRALEGSGIDHTWRPASLAQIACTRQTNRKPEDQDVFDDRPHPS